MPRKRGHREAELSTVRRAYAKQIMSAAGSPLSLVISTGHLALTRGSNAAQIWPTAISIRIVLLTFLTAILHISVIVLCCFGLGIRHPWSWYKASGMRAQRAAYERVESLDDEGSGPYSERTTFQQ